MKNRYTTTDEVRKLNGVRLYMLRKEHKITQNKLAQSIGITFQQIQKYEWGQNAMSTYAMYKFAKMFGVNMEYFFKPLDQISYERKQEVQNSIR